MELFRCYAFSPRACDDLSRVLRSEIGRTPVFLCVGSDKIVGDSLAPVVAENLRRFNLPYYIYGGLNAPITAQNCEFAYEFIRAMHPTSMIVLIDSMATYEQARLGDIVVSREYYGAINKLNIKPDLCIYGVNSLLRNNLLNCARLRNVLHTAQVISNAIYSATQITEDNIISIKN